MSTFTLVFNKISAIGTIILLVIDCYLIFSVFIQKNAVVRSFFQKNAAMLGFLIALGGECGSFIYSNIIGYPPCLLCWIQRIALAGILLLSLISLSTKKHKILSYALIFAVIGAIVALYNTIIMYVGFSPLPCSATVSCTTRYVYEFGFVTIPLMSLSLFILLKIIFLSANKRNTLSA